MEPRSQVILNLKRNGNHLSRIEEYSLLSWSRKKSLIGSGTKFKLGSLWSCQGSTNSHYCFTKCGNQSSDLYISQTFCKFQITTWMIFWRIRQYKFRPMMIWNNVDNGWLTRKLLSFGHFLCWSFVEHEHPRIWEALITMQYIFRSFKSGIVYVVESWEQCVSNIWEKDRGWKHSFTSWFELL